MTTLRAAMVVGADSAAFETIVALVDRLPGMVCPRWVSTRTQPIALADVVGYLAGVAGREEMLGESFDAGGPEVMTYREMIERIARLRGKRPLIVEVPVLTPRLSSYWLHLVTPVKAAVARPLIEGLRNATVARDDRLRRLVPLRLTPFDDAARAALAGGRRRGEVNGLRVGYACVNTRLPSAARTLRLANATPERLRELIAANLDALEAILRWNAENGIEVFRLTSNLIPFGSHPANRLAWWNEFGPRLAELGERMACGGRAFRPTRASTRCCRRRGRRSSPPRSRSSSTTTGC